MPDNLFSLLHPAPRILAPRLGKLAVPGRKPLSTPHHLATTSRGIVPHLTHDVMRDHTSIGGLYMALEDCTYIVGSGASSKAIFGRANSIAQLAQRSHRESTR
jgi:hypothetical protein